jgi:hypothetical protein
MVHHLFTRKTDKPDFPERVDLPFLTDKEANAALGLLRLLVETGAAEVYTQPVPDPITCRYRWNVWLNHHVVPGGKRIELREWAAGVVCRDFTPDDAA